MRAGMSILVRNHETYFNLLRAHQRHMIDSLTCTNTTMLVKTLDTLQH